MFSSASTFSPASFPHVCFSYPHLVYFFPVTHHHFSISPSRTHHLSHPPPPTLTYPTTRSTAGVAGFGYNLETASSPATDRGTSSSDSVDPEDTWWVAAACGAGVGLIVVLLGAVLFTKYGKRKDHVGAKSKPGRSAVRSGFPDETKAEPDY